MGTSFTPTSRRILAIAIVWTSCTFAGLGQPNGWANDWLTMPGRYSHHHASGTRVNQYSAVDAPPLNDQTALTTGGFTHLRSTLQYGHSVDNYHRTQQWGAPVRPYEEWRFPYRPYSVPYDQWGSPWAGMNVFPGVGFPGVGFPGGGFPGMGFPGGMPVDGNGLQPGAPWIDGLYPDYPPTPRLNDRQFFFQPSR